MDQAQQLRNVIKVRNQNYVTPARVITVTSGKGGVGKSNTSVNLAVWLSRAGKKVIIFDADFGLANVEVMFGVVPKFTLADLIYEDRNIKEIITSGPLGIDFISAGSSIIGLNNLTYDQIRFLVQSIGELNSLYDFIIIDTGAGISDQVMEFVAASPEVLLVTTPDPMSITDSYSLLKALFKRNDFVQEHTKIRVISNKVASRDDGNTVFNKLNSVVMQFLSGSLEYLGYIPSDSAVEKSVRQQQIVSIYEPSSKASKAYEDIASRVLNDESAPLIGKRSITQIFSSFLNRKQ
ncbi:MinD/ParA family protein [Agathobacter sp.]